MSSRSIRGQLEVSVAGIPLVSHLFATVLHLAFSSVYTSSFPTLLHSLRSAVPSLTSKTTHYQDQRPGDPSP